MNSRKISELRRDKFISKVTIGVMQKPPECYICNEIIRLDETCIKLGSFAGIHHKVLFLCEKCIERIVDCL